MGEWTITVVDSCEDQDGKLFTDNYTGPAILNQDGTVTLEEDGNTESDASFTLIDGVLTITATFKQFLPSSCNPGIQTISEISTLEYDELTDTFIGTHETVASNVSGCDWSGSICSGTVTLER